MEPYKMANGKTGIRGFNVFNYADEVAFNRTGKRIYARSKDGTFVDSDSVEANLLFEILKTLKNKK